MSAVDREPALAGLNANWKSGCTETQGVTLIW